MNAAIEQAEELRKRAIEILLTERAEIDERLAMLSYDAVGLGPPAGNKRRTCGICGSSDHNARRCSKSATSAEKAPGSETLPVA